MRRVWAIAVREFLEQRRQPIMLATMTTLLVLVCTLPVATLMLLQTVQANPDAAAPLVARFGELAPLQDHMLTLMIFLGASQYLGMCAVLAGHSMLHERQCHTFTYLLLAPVRRWELLTGKVIGAILWPTVLYAVVVGSASVVTSFTHAGHRSPWLCFPSASWAASYALAIPSWTLATAAACALVSASARDVRTAQQGVWFVVFFASLAIGPALVASIPQGAILQLALAGTGLVTTATLIYAGSLLLRRDIGR